MPMISLQFTNQLSNDILVFKKIRPIFEATSFIDDMPIALHGRTAIHGGGFGRAVDDFHTTFFSRQ